MKPTSKRAKSIFTISMVILYVFIFFSCDALAAISNEGILVNVLIKYHQIASTWQKSILNHAMRLFWILATISLVWTYGQMLFQKADIAAFFGETIRFIMFTGFFYWLLVNGPNFAHSIIKSLEQIGGEASNQGIGLNPSGIIDVGFQIIEQTLKASSAFKPGLSLASMLLAVLILLMLASIAINMLLQLCSAWILAYAGIFFLGFGGSRWTSDIAINYYKNVLSVAVSLFTMILITGIGKTIIDEYQKNMSNNFNVNELCVMLIVAFTLLELVNKVPNMVASVATGGSIGSSGIGSFGGTAAALGAAATALSGAAGAIKGAVGVGKAVGTTAGGGLAALKAACDVASQAQQMGTGAFAGMKPNAPGDGSLTRAMHGSPAFCAELGKSLASGAGKVAKAKVDSIKRKAGHAIATSTGGKIASAINKQASGNQQSKSDDSKK